MPSKDRMMRNQVVYEFKSRAYAKGLCKSCYHKPHAPGKTYCEGCLTRSREYQRKWNRTQKVETMNQYGGKCACCGETRISMLTLDHINNNGAEHRRQMGKTRAAKGGIGFYRWLKENKYPQGYLQVLCANCNTSKLANSGTCEHHTEKELINKVFCMEKTI